MLITVYTRMTLAFIMLTSLHVIARERFNPGFLSIGGETATTDLSYFERQGGQSPGDYLVDIYVNQKKWKTRTMTFIAGKDGVLEPKITLAMLEDMGVNTAALPGQPSRSAAHCETLLPRLLPDAMAHLDFSNLTLYISIPQVFMKPESGQGVSRDEWQEGIPTGLLNYSISGDRSLASDDTSRASSNQFASLNGGINVDAWRLRSQAIYRHTRVRETSHDSLSQAMALAERHDKAWQIQQTYLQRDLPAIRSELTLGDTALLHTSSQIFDGFLFRGVALGTSTAMLPPALSHYAPVIQGTAQSNATVTVRQNGVLIYQTSVPPGPFRFTNITGGYSGGELQVTVRESDGSEHGFSLPYGSLPVMQREGHLIYEIDAGRYREQSGYVTAEKMPVFSLLSVDYGLPFGITMYGGTLFSTAYRSLSAGSGMSLGYAGGLSADVTFSHAKFPHSGATRHALSGEAIRLQYAKNISSTATTLNMAFSRYDSQQFMTFSDANRMGGQASGHLMPWLNQARRYHILLQVNQSLFKTASVFVNAQRDAFWSNNQVNNTLSAGINVTIKRMPVSVSYSLDRIRGKGDWPQNRTVGLTLSIPFSIFASPSSESMSEAAYSLSHTNDGTTYTTTTLQGNEGNLSWAVLHGAGNKRNTRQDSASLGYNGSSGNMNLGYSNSANGYRHLNYAINGGAVAHQHGVTLSRTLSDTAILVQAPGAGDVRVGGEYTDKHGYAVIPAAQPYRRNTVSIDPSTLPDDVDISETTTEVYPTWGAIALASFGVRKGRRLIMTLDHSGRAVPFGATVSLKPYSTRDDAIMGDGGNVYLTGAPDQGVVYVKWGKRPDQRCKAHYNLQGVALRTLTPVISQCQ